MDSYVRSSGRALPAGGICRAVSFRTTFSQTSEWTSNSLPLMPSRSSPPVLSSLLWHLKQCWVTNFLTEARSSRDSPEGGSLAGCCAQPKLTEPTANNRTGIQQWAKIHERRMTEDSGNEIRIVAVGRTANG